MVIYTNKHVVRSDWWFCCREEGRPGVGLYTTGCGSLPTQKERQITMRSLEMGQLGHYHTLLTWCNMEENWFSLGMVIQQYFHSCSCSTIGLRRAHAVVLHIVPNTWWHGLDGLCFDFVSASSFYESEILFELLWILFIKCFRWRYIYSQDILKGKWFPNATVISASLYEHLNALGNRSGHNSILPWAGKSPVEPSLWLNVIFLE